MKTPNLSPRQLELFKELYPKHTPKRVSDILGIEQSEVEQIAILLGLRKEDVPIAILTAKQVAIFRDLYPRRSKQRVAEVLGIRLSDVKLLAKRLIVRKPAELTPAQIKTFKELYPIRSKRRVADVVGIPESSVNTIALSLGFFNKIDGTLLAQFKAFYPMYPNKVIYEKLGLSRYKIERLAREHKLVKVLHTPLEFKKRKFGLRFPPPGTLEQFKALYPMHPNKVVAERLNLSRNKVERLAHALGLRKSAKTLEAPKQVQLKPVASSALKSRLVVKAPSLTIRKPRPGILADEQLVRFKVLYPENTNQEVADLMGLSLNQVVGLARRWRTHKSKAFLRLCAQRRIAKG